MDRRRQTELIAVQERLTARPNEGEFLWDATLDS
jgi:hypothetical protein